LFLIFPLQVLPPFLLVEPSCFPSAFNPRGQISPPAEKTMQTKGKSGNELKAGLMDLPTIFL
jgi:hypothetical protein